MTSHADITDILDTKKQIRVLLIRIYKNPNPSSINCEFDKAGLVILKRRLLHHQLRTEAFINNLTKDFI